MAIDPGGRGVFVLGVNTVMRDTRNAGVPRCDGIGDHIRPASRGPGSRTEYTSSNAKPAERPSSASSACARIRGWSNRGGAGAFVPSTDSIDDQLQRGQRYRSQIDQFIGFRHVVGAVWHAWSDRFSAEDASLQIGLGLVQCTDPPRGMNAGRRWEGTDRLIAQSNRAILQSIAAGTGF